MQVQRTTPRRRRVETGIYVNPSTGKLEISWRDPRDGRSRWHVVDGDLSRARVERAKAQAGFDPSPRKAGFRRSFRQVAEEWYARSAPLLRPRTAENYARALDKHLFPRIGDLAVGAIDENVVARIISELHEQGLAGWTIRGILVPLGRTLGYAQRQKLIAENPVRRLDRHERPRVIRREMRILEPAEIYALLRAATIKYRPLLATAVFSGLRQGELLGLRWAEVDFVGGVIRVRHQLDRVGHYVEPKTPRGVRAVVLTPSLATLLTQHRDASAFVAETDPVFATSTGTPMYFRNMTRWGFYEAVRVAGLNGDGKPNVRFHDLRHTYASLLIAQGLNVAFISRQLGHSKMSFTLDTYGGLFDQVEHAHRAVDLLEAKFGAMLAATSEAGQR